MNVGLSYVCTPTRLVLCGSCGIQGSQHGALFSVLCTGTFWLVILTPPHCTLHHSHAHTYHATD